MIARVRIVTADAKIESNVDLEDIERILHTDAGWLTIKNDGGDYIVINIKYVQVIEKIPFKGHTK